MNYVEYGKENSDVIILLHGGGLSWWNYKEVAERLQTDYHVVLPILDGHAGCDKQFTTIENNALDIIEFVNSKLDGSVLIKYVILVLRLSMEYAYKERAIPLLNWDLIEYPKELGIKKVVSLSKDQEQALIQCIYMDLNRKTAGILIALFTGVRIGELCGLQMRDISLTDKTISINKTVQRIYDKKKGESYLHIGPPKTKTSARTIPVPSLLMNIIKKFYTENPNHYFLTGKTKPTEPRTYRQFFTRFLKRNGLEKVKFHEIRHTFAVRAIEIPEFDIKSLSEILGHKNVSFTLNVYGSANLQQKVKCMNLLNDLL